MHGCPQQSSPDPRGARELLRHSTPSPTTAFSRPANKVATSARSARCPSAKHDLQTTLWRFWHRNLVQQSKVFLQKHRGSEANPPAGRRGRAHRAAQTPPGRPPPKAHPLAGTLGLASQSRLSRSGSLIASRFGEEMDGYDLTGELNMSTQRSSRRGGRSQSQQEAPPHDRYSHLIELQKSYTRPTSGDQAAPPITRRAVDQLCPKSHRAPLCSPPKGTVLNVLCPARRQSARSLHAARTGRGEPSK